MTTEEQIRENLDKVLIPGVMRSPLKMNLVRNISIKDDQAAVTLSSTALAPEIQNNLADDIRKVVSKIDNISEVNVEFTDAKAKDINQVNSVIAVMSG